MSVPAALPSSTPQNSPEPTASPPHPSHTASRLSNLISTVLVCAVLIGAAWWLLNAQHHATVAHAPGPAAAPEPVVVTVAPVTLRSVQRTVSVVGSLYGQEEVTIVPKVSGRVVEVVREAGDVVRAGDVLLRIERTEYELAVAEARRALELELTKLGVTELPAANYDLSKLPSIVRTRAEELSANSRVVRVRELSLKQALSKEELETAEMNFAVAQANSQQTLLDSQALLATARQRQAVLETALQRLSETQVVAPGLPTGQPGTLQVKQEYVVSKRDIAVGEMIQTLPGNSNPVYTLVIDNPLKLVTTIPERHRAEIHSGQQVDLLVEYYPSEKFSGTVARVNPVVDRTSRTFEVEIAVPNADRRLSAGSFVRATINTQVDPQAPTVPEQALVKLAGVTKVFVVQDEVAHEIQVAPQGQVEIPGQRYPQAWIEVSGKIPAQSVVVTSGFSRLSDGSPVRIRTPE